MKHKIIISGGGSGGHVFPAIAIANELKTLEPETEILFVGAQDKIEMEKVPKAGFPIEGLWISGLHRKLTLRNLMFPFKLISSLWKSWRILRRFKPQVVVGVGGFASGPILEMATRLGIPCLIQEQNSFPGITNRLLAKKVDRICVADEKLSRFFPADKMVLTGNPVRQDIVAAESEKAKALAHFGLDSKRPVILMFGGSLGASSMNKALAESAALIEAHPEVQILWQAGSLYYEQYKSSRAANLPNVYLQAFIDRMDWAYLIADVVICRAGALTIAELAMVAKPAILVPSPNVAEDHQSHNARSLVTFNAVLMVNDEDAADQMLPKALELLDNKALQAQLSENIGKIARPGAAGEIAAEVLKLCEK